MMILMSSIICSIFAVAQLGTLIFVSFLTFSGQISDLWVASQSPCTEETVI
jgi:hypothetical protein